ncbi:MAG: carboxylesterase family protein [Anaerolineae bacterium]|nr:carboxylesterase family protein [Anaerolineae bacterium]
MEFTIQTQAGEITGLQKEDHQAFLGIRYAQPPIGALRFQPPQRIDEWPGTYDATQYAPMAPQARPDMPPILLEESEDCLNLNIFTPDADGPKKPVMVFIHGGGFLIDSCSRPRTYGGTLAARGDVVVVTIEYRMGAFGFLAMDGVSPNLGLQDQVCALEWVQRNIAGWGGDPNNVTIFGQSAGATSVAYLLVMPSAKGLFHKAILQSGAFPLETLADNRRFAESSTHRLLKALNIASGELEKLRAFSMEEIIKAQKKAVGRLLFSDRAFYPIIDGKIIPENVLQELQENTSQGIPVLMGDMAEELPAFGGIIKSRLLTLFLKGMLVNPVKKLGLTKTQVNTLLELYRKELPAEDRVEHREYNHLLSDATFRVPIIRMAESILAGKGQVHTYCFAYRAPRSRSALHVLDLYFVFGTLGTEDAADIMKVSGTDAEEALSRAMIAAWTNFAKNGDPNTELLPSWPAYTLQNRTTMNFDLHSAVVDSPADPIRAYWKECLHQKYDHETTA